AQELSEEGGVGVSAPDTGTGTGVQGSLKGGLIAGALTLLVGSLPGMLEFLDGIYKILQAFLAPVSLMLMRILMPFLRMAIQILPIWYDIWNTLLGYQSTFNEFIWNMATIAAALFSLPIVLWDTITSDAGWLSNGASNIGSAIWNKISSGASWFTNGASAIGREVWQRAKQLPGMIADKIFGGGERSPRMSTAGPLRGQSTGRPGQSWVDEIADAVDGGDTLIRFEGGIGALIERIERDANIDLP
ncbi:MAG: hypothetical protein ACOCUA_03045, partial [archaeon]